LSNMWIASIVLMPFDYENKIV